MGGRFTLLVLFEFLVIYGGGTHAEDTEKVTRWGDNRIVQSGGCRTRPHSKVVVPAVAMVQ